MRKPWWQHEATIAWALILFFPLGIFMMWRYAPWRGRFKWLWTAAAAIVALLIVAGAAGGGGTEDSSRNAEATGSTGTNAQTEAVSPTMTTQELAYVEGVATGEAEDARVATAAAEQTKAPQPTETPEPTRTPEPATPPRLTAEECDYLTEVAEEYATPLSESLPKFVDLSYQAASDPMLIFDNEWKIEVATELATWSVSRERFAAMTPPSSLAGFHAKFLDALTRLDSAGTLFAEGVDEVDPDKINRASAQMNEGTALLDEANDLLTQFQSEHSGGC
jgi:hypothetical protein